MNLRLSLWISTLLLGVLVVVFQLTPWPRQQEQRTLQHFSPSPDLEDKAFNAWRVENLYFGTDDTNKSFIHPPCKKTKVEQQRLLHRPSVERVYEERYQPNVDMVVALCRENILKIKRYATNLRVNSLYIYSKCDQSIQLDDNFIQQFEKVEITELPNVGREGHTFLTHMLRGDLDPNRWTIFLQGQIEKDLRQAMLSLVAAHEHDEQNDGTNFINMYRVRDKFCSPIYVPRSEFHAFWHAHNFPRYQSHRGSHKYLDVMGKQLLYRGEFVAKNSLFESLDKEKILEIKKRLEVGNNPYEGQYLERFWIGVLGASDNCRCEGFPLNNLPMSQKLAMRKPTHQSSTVGNLVADNAVDGKNMTAGITKESSYASAKPQEGEEKSWWAVDLETLAIIPMIRIYLPPCCKDSLEYSVLEILDYDQEQIIRKPIIHNADDGVSFDTDLMVTLRFNNVEGRFVRITKSDGKHLNIAQVEVAGFARNLKFSSPFTPPAPPVREVNDMWMSDLV